MKVEIPESVKAVLRCGECDELLSCGPVFLVHGTNEAICGRCSQQPPEKEDASSSTSENRNRSRNIQYEAVAKLLLFPCRYSPQGCPEKLDFSEDASNIHERDCEFRTFFCPIVAHGSCNWIGSSQKLGDHCRDKHPTHFFQNPFILPRTDLPNFNLSKFLVSAYNFLFLVHVQVCLTSKQLFHSVCMFGNPELLDGFSYSLEIEKNNKKLRENNSVLRPEIMTLEEPYANCTSIDDLQSFLDGKYEELNFTITIQTSIRNCLNCLKDFVINVSDSEFCCECLGKLVKCQFSENGCLYVDFNEGKCKKHAKYFCKYQTKCLMFGCGVNFVGGPMIEHLSSSNSCRKTTKANNNSVVRVTRSTSSNWNIILLSSKNIGTIKCQYKLYNFDFRICLYTSLPSFKLKNFKCSVEITDPQTKQTEIFTSQIHYTDWDDWRITKRLNNLHYPSCKNIGIDVKINIEKL